MTGRANPQSTLDGVEAAVRAGLSERLRAEQPTAMLAHLVALAALAALLWGSLPPAGLVAWIVAVVLATGGRLVALRGAAALAFDRLQARLRVALAILGLAWGGGAALLAARMPAAYFALVIAVLGTLVAGAASTLQADPTTFRAYALGLLAPITVSSVALGQDRLYLIAALLLVCFAAFMVAINRRGHEGLVAWLRTAAELEAANERLRDREHQLQTALSEVKTLQGLIRICASCKRVLTDKGSWEQFESYVRGHSDVEFSHGICPECARKQWGSLDPA